jgi:hypothetical protein
MFSTSVISWRRFCSNVFGSVFEVMPEFLADVVAEIVGTRICAAYGRLAQRESTHLHTALLGCL